MKNWSVFLFVCILLLTAASAGDLDGKWDFKAESSDGQVFELILTLWEADGELKGTLGNYEGDIPLEDVKLDGNQLHFSITTPDWIKYQAEIKVTGDQMAGAYKGDDGSSGKITAKRSN